MGKGLARRLTQLEGNSSVRDSMRTIYQNVLRKKKEFNGLRAVRGQLVAAKAKWKQILADTNSKKRSKTGSSSTMDSLLGKSEDAKTQLNEERIDAIQLRYMITTRKECLLSIANSVRELKGTLTEVNRKTATLQKLCDQNEIAVRFKKREFTELQAKVESQQKEMKVQFEKELKLYKDRKQAVAFYRKGKEEWYKRKSLHEKEREMNGLKPLEKKLLKEEEFRKEAKLLSKQLTDKDTYISHGLSVINMNSIEELACRLEKLKETRESIMNTQIELENKLSQQSVKTIELNDELNHAATQKQVKYTEELKLVATLEAEYRVKNRLIQNKNILLETLQQKASFTMLALAQLTRRFSEDLIDHDNAESLSSALESFINKLSSYL